MGVKNLNLFLRSVGVTEEWLPYSNFAGKRVAIDAAYLMHRFKAANGNLWDMLLNNFVVACVINNKIDMTFVFDGIAPIEKTDELAARASRRAAALLRQQNIAAAVTNGDESVIDKCKTSVARRYNVRADMVTARMVNDYVEHRVRTHQAVTPEDYDRMRAILTGFGVPYTFARTEGEMHCVQMVANGQADLVMTIDTDAILVSALHSVPYVLTNFKAGCFRQVSVHEVLENCHMTPAQFLDFCILLGTDFNKHIRGIGHVKAQNLIKTHGSIDNMHTVVDTSQLGDYKRVREIFMSYG
ncbi:DNA repair protein RAD2 [Rock bream iridovirus]|uniref:DNA repair protein RAD2 n=1 Tax=Rock bream iridovirus TaxID=263891 RepID=Q5YF59_ISKNV|nr:DNA repair protein RAD2 [Rock bream iridovirus]